MPSSLILPGGRRHMLEKDAQHMSRQSLQTISRMHDVNAELGDIEVRCLKCGESFQGSNNANDAVLKMACGCRELVYVKP